MTDLHSRQQQLEAILKTLSLPEGIQLRAWQEGDFPAIQRLTAQHGWVTPTRRPTEALLAWKHSCSSNETRER